MPKSPQKAAPAKSAAGQPAEKPVPAKAPATGAGKGDHVFLVDGSSYIFRAYHALPPLTRKSDGLQVNAVLGFCNMLWKLLRDMPEDNRPTHLAIIFDKSEITFRNKLYPDYKAHRPPAPDDLIPQFGLIRDAVRAFDLPCLEQAGFEADDLIATYARLASERGATTTIVSSDKDLMQLVTDKVLMYDTMKDRRIGIPEVIEKFGVPPEKVVEVQALAGDSTDNVPGVPGIGVKTAAQLIVEYGDLEQLLFRATEIKQPKRREALIENAEKARISRQLVLLDDKVDLDVPLEELAVHEPDARKLIAFLKAMEFSTLTKRVAEYSQIDPSDVAADGGGKSSPPAPRAGDQGVDLLSTFDSPTAKDRAGAGGGAPAKPGDKVRQGLQPQGLADLARRGAQGGRAKTAVRPHEISDHPHARRAERLDRPRPRRRPFRDRRQGELDRSDAGRHLRHCAGAGAERRLLHSARAQAIRRRRRPVRCGACAGPDQGERGAGRAEAAAGIRRHPQDRLQRQVQRGDVRAGRHHAAQRRRRAADVAMRSTPAATATPSTRSPTSGSATARSPMAISSAAARASSPSTRSRSTGRPNIPPRVPT